MRRILLLAITLVVGQLAIAQSTTIGEEVSDRTKEKYLEKAKELFEEDADDKDFKILKSTKDYSNESAVILCMRTSFNCEVSGTIDVSNNVHKRILLLDKRAIEEYSTFTGYVVGQNGSLGIKVIKPNGDTKFYCINDALEIKPDENESRPSYNKEYKLAIPNLEAGDIIDFIKNESFEFPKSSATTINLPNYYYPLQGDEPIVKQKLNFYMHSAFLLSFKSINGASALKEDELDERKYRSFTFVDSNRESIRSSRWLFNKREVPMIKFSICNKGVASNYLDYPNFYNEDVEDPKIDVSKEELKIKLERYFKKFSTSVILDFKSKVKTVVKKYNDDTENKDAIMKIMYYVMKYNMCVPKESFVNGIVVYSPNFYSTWRTKDDVNKLLSKRVNTLWFVSEMVKVMEYYDIKGSVVVAPDRRLTSVKDIAFMDELEYAIKYKDKIIYAPNGYSNMYDGNEYLEGQEGYEATAIDGDFSEFKTFVPFTFPVSSNTQNIMKSTLLINIDESNFEKLRVSDSSTYVGLQEEYKAKYFTSKDYLKLSNDCKNVMKVELDEEEEEEDIEKLSVRKAEAARKKKEYKEQEKKNLLDKCKEGAKENYPTVLEVDTAKIISLKNSPNEAEISMDYNTMVLGDLIKKVGPNYAIELGKVIGSQVELKQKEKDRDYNIWIDYAKEFQNIIRLKIPAGFKAEGLDNFNFNVDNAAGSFISKANVVGNEVIITTNKKYKKNFMPKEEWAGLAACMDAAYNFTQKKLILKKN
jgi:hypothetical protein